MDLQQIYEKLLADESILTLQQLARHFGFGSKRYLKMCKSLYEKYGKDVIVKITRTRLSKHSLKIQWESRSRVMSSEVRQKISDSNKIAWADDINRKEISRETMKKNFAHIDRKEVTKKAIETRRKNDKWAEYSVEGKENLIRKTSNRNVSDETKQKMSESAKNRGFCRNSGWSYPTAARKNISSKIKNLWKDGKYKKIYQSKVSLELIESLQSLGYDVTSEFFIDGRPFDIKIKNCIIEFNGTYWHLDPRKYLPDYFDTSRKVYARDVWECDRIKTQLAEDNGYKVFIVWQSDWKNNKQEVIESVKRFIEHI